MAQDMSNQAQGKLTSEIKDQSNPLVQSLRDRAENMRRTGDRDDERAMLRAANEIERLQVMVVEWVNTHTYRGGYDCLDCGMQIVFGDSDCPVTKKPHPVPVKPPVCAACGGKGVRVDLVPHPQRGAGETPVPQKDSL